MDPAEVRDDLAGLEAVLLINVTRTVQLLARSADVRRADAELRRVEVERSPVVRAPVRDRERRARRSHARERAGRDRVVDPEPLRVVELQVRPELDARDTGSR